MARPVAVDVSVSVRGAEKAVTTLYLCHVYVPVMSYYLLSSVIGTEQKASKTILLCILWYYIGWLVHVHSNIPMMGARS